MNFLINFIENKIMAKKLLKKDTLLRSFIPKDIDYDDIKSMSINLKHIQGSVSVIVGEKGEDRGEGEELSVTKLIELINSIASSEGLKTSIVGEVSGKGKDTVYGEVDITISKK